MAGKKTSWNAHVGDVLSPLGCEPEVASSGGYVAKLVCESPSGRIVAFRSHVMHSRDDAQGYCDTTAIAFGLT